MRTPEYFRIAAMCYTSAYTLFIIAFVFILTSEKICSFLLVFLPLYGTIKPDKATGIPAVFPHH